MSQLNIAVLVGSLRRDLFNAQLARATPADFSLLPCVQYHS